MCSELKNISRITIFCCFPVNEIFMKYLIVDNPSAAVVICSLLTLMFHEYKASVLQVTDVKLTAGI